MKKVIVMSLMLLASAVFAQYMAPAGMIDGATGNLVYTTVNPLPPGADPVSWSGFTTTTSNGGGISGGYTPGYNPNTGTFMFGYTARTVAYSTPVNYALSSAGSNIQVNGFRYSWEYINQDYSRGSLTGNINLTNKSGQVVENYNYNMPRTTNGWTMMSGIQNFNTQYAASTIDRLNVSFTGKDDRYWAGYYGPQIRAIDVGLLYSVTPPPVPTDFLKWVPLVNENDNFTLNTAGVVRYGANGVYVYQNFQPGTYSCSNSAWGVDPIGGVYKSCSFGSNNVTPTTTTTALPKTTTTTDTYTSGLTVLDPVTTTVADPITTTTTTTATTTTTTDTASTPTASSTTQQNVVSAVVSAPAPATTSSSSTITASSSSSSSTSSSSQSSKESTNSSSGSTSLALSIISKNSERDAAGSAVAQSAVAQAQQAAATAQQEASNVASSATSNSLTVNAVSSGGQQSSGNGIRMSNSNSNGANFSLQSGLSTVATVGGPQTSNNMVIQQQNSNTAGVNVATGQQVVVVNAGSQQSTTNTATTFVLPLVQPQQASMFTPAQTYSSSDQVTQIQTQQNNTAGQNTETYSLATPNMLTDKTNPLTDIVEGKQTITQNNTTITTGPVVNKDAQDNDAAGGVSINRIALAPVGYNDYLSLALRDAAFYAPREVYKNQRNVDNARALRSLTNDSKHQEMIDQQYRR